jgi:hypothetical protein
VASPDPTPPLPPLYEARLDAAGAARLLDDVERAARLLDVLVKTGPREHAGREPVTLEEARRIVAEGGAWGLQLRYLFEGEEWRDTLLRDGEGWRVFRMRRGAG